MKKKSMIQRVSNLVMVAIFAGLFFCCTGTDEDEDLTGNDNSNSSSSSGSGSNSSSSDSDDGSDLVSQYSFDNIVKITMGSTASVTNSMADDGVTVSVKGGDVTVTSTAENVRYEISGSTSDGSLKIYSDKKFQLALNGVSITNGDGAAINVQSTKRVFVDLVDGTTNTLTDGSSYTTSDDEDMKGCFFSEGQLIFNGTGSLTVKGNYKHAICSDDYVHIYEGVIAATAVTDGVHTNDAFIMDGGSLTVNSGSDGIECDEGHILIESGTLSVTSVDDGITTSYEGTDSDPYITIDGGEISIVTSGASGKGIKSLGNLTINGGSISVKTSATEAEGIESKNELVINDGTVEVNAKDDGINAANALEINGGSVYVYSESNDAIDSNGSMSITGGVIVASGTSAPEDAFDCDNGTITIKGGTLIGIGGGTSLPNSSNAQAALVYGGSAKVNTMVSLTDSEGALIMAFVYPRTLNSMTLLFSSANFKTGSSYTLSSGGTISEGSAFHGFYTSGTVSGASQLTTFTASSAVTTVNYSGGGMGGNGGGMGGNQH